MLSHFQCGLLVMDTDAAAEPHPPVSLDTTTLNMSQCNDIGERMWVKVKCE